MQKKLILFIIVLILGAVLSVLFLKDKDFQPESAICAMDVKQCPDGSYVGRQGPDCQFAECPTPKTTSSETGKLTGQVTLSPVCPVMRTPPPDASCDPKPYAVLIDIFQNNRFLFQVHADKDGFFMMNLPVGNYKIEPHVEALYPRCESKDVEIKANVTTTADISCDTGIR